MKKWPWILAIAAAITAPVRAVAADNLRLNPHLDYSSDSQDGPLITGDHFEEGPVVGKPAYIIFYGEGCFNSKRQARRTVDLYEEYRGKVQFVIVDLDQRRTAWQDALVKQYFRGSIPHVVVMNRDGQAVYNAAGEVGEKEISRILDGALQH